MRRKRITVALAVLAFTLLALAYAAVVASAHCDGMDGPVVKAAQKALKSGNINLILVWVGKNDEAEVREAFRKTVAVRRQGRQARELADRYFFETLVRLHRAGEGEPYTGLKPAGRDLGPVIPAADRALETGSAEVLLKLFTGEARAEVEVLFRAALTSKNYDPDDVGAGRAYVHAYIRLMHHAEHLYEEGQRGAVARPVRRHHRDARAVRDEPAW
jgi:hypothetical protein